MSEKTSEILEWSRPFIPNSGSVTVAFDGERFGTVSFEEQHVEIDLARNAFAARPMPHISRRFMRLSYVSFISESLDRIGLSLSIRDESGELAKMGKGVHSILGGARVKILHLAKYLK